MEEANVSASAIISHSADTASFCLCYNAAMSAELTPLTSAEAAPVSPKLERIYHLLVQAYGKPDWCPDGDAFNSCVL